MQEAWYIIASLVLLASSALPLLLLNTPASAATLSSRKVTITDSTPAKTGVGYTFAFTTQSSTTIQSMIFQFCNTPLGTCALPGEATNNGTDNNVEIDVSAATAAPGTFTGTSGTAFAEVSSDTGACTDADTGSQIATMYCVNRTEATSETAGAKTFEITGITNPTIQSGNNNEPVYVRITTFSDTSFGTAVDDGTVAASIVNQLTVTGRVQERLVFCAFALDDAAGSNNTVGTGNGEFPTSCAANEANDSSNVDIGVVDNSTIARSPVDNSPPSSLGNDRFGATMVNTNASGGVSVAYFATQASSGTNQLRAFRVSGAVCDGTPSVVTDQCFVSASDNSNAGTTISAGTEGFGMQMACVTNSNTTTAGTTANLGAGGNGTGATNTFRTAYANGDTALAGDFEDNGTDTCEAEAGDLYAWNDSGTAQAIIGSNTVVDDEVVKLRFGASANATTPTGTYTAATTFIATATF